MTSCLNCKVEALKWFELVWQLNLRPIDIYYLSQVTYNLFPQKVKLNTDDMLYLPFIISKIKARKI